MSVIAIPDYIPGWRATDTTRGTEIVRPFLCVNVDTTDPTTIANQCWNAVGVPPLYTPHPSVQYVTVQDRPIRSIDHPSAVIMDIVYRSVLNTATNTLGSVVWAITDSQQTNSIQTYSTAGGAATIATYYPESDSVPQQAAQAPKFVPTRIVRVTGAMTASDWNSYKYSVRDLAGQINQATWAGEDRGYWYFAGPSTTTIDFGQSYTITLDFYGEPLLWYPISYYIDPTTGLHPSDSFVDAQVRVYGPPAVGAIVQQKGIVQSSVFDEGDFSIFAFGGLI